MFLQVFQVLLQQLISIQSNTKEKEKKSNYNIALVGYSNLVGTKGFLCQNCKLVNLPTTNKNGIQKSFSKECQKDMITYRKSAFKVCDVKFCECFGF
jgi:hypothetical protein